MAKRVSAPRESKPKLADAERHKRFVEMAHEVGASESPKAFNKAFKRVVRGLGAKTATGGESGTD